MNRRHDRAIPLRIVSGGQTGVDRGALDAALDAGVECGGWCPADRSAEDGRIPARYPLHPAPRPGYSERTLRNVLDSDATLILYFGALSGGTEETLRRCLELGRPYQLIDAGEVPPEGAGQAAAEFVRSHDIQVLNVAGPRASRWPGGRDYARRAVAELCRIMGAAETSRPHDNPSRTDTGLMKPRLAVVTLGVQDLERAVTFYRDGLGFPTNGIVGQEFEHGAVAFFPLQPGLQLALWPRADLAHDAGLPQAPPSATELSLGHNVNSRAEVDAVMELARAAGATMVKPAQDTFWGGYAGYFQDPDGHLWEVVWNPQLVVDE